MALMPSHNSGPMQPDGKQRGRGNGEKIKNVFKKLGLWRQAINFGISEKELKRRKRNICWTVWKEDNLERWMMFGNNYISLCWAGQDRLEGPSIHSIPQRPVAIEYRTWWSSCVALL